MCELKAYKQQYSPKLTVAVVNNSQSVSMGQCLWMDVAVCMCVLGEKSRLQDKLGHY